MHDYVKGCFEALSWVKTLFREDKKYLEIREKVERALDDLEEGVALDFRRNLTPTRS